MTRNQRRFIPAIFVIMMTGIAFFGGLNLAAAAAPSAAIQPAVEPKVEALIRDLRDADPHKRVAAADALAKLGPQARPAIPALLEAMDGTQKWTDFAMMDALGAIGPTAIPELLNIFAKGQGAMRIRAGKALWDMGGAAESALPELEKLLNDPDDTIKAVAASAIKKIQSELAEKTERAKTSAVKPETVSATPVRPSAGDWPDFRGPHRDALCAETGLYTAWPKEGLKLLWKLEGLGKGLSTVSIAQGRIYTQGDRDKDGTKAQYLLAIDLEKPRELWAINIGGAYDEFGALSTPVIDETRLYTLSTDGNLLCVKIPPKDANGRGQGEIVWRKSLPGDLGGKMMNVWKYSESPLVDGDRLICTPGGSNCMMAALNKYTGETIWQCAVPSLGSKGKDGAGYASPIAVEIEGVRQYIQLTGRGAIGVAAKDGRFLWGYNRIASDYANIPNPIVRGNYVFLANGYNTGAALLKIRRDNDHFTADEVYWLASKDFQNHHGGVVLVGDSIYGGSGLNKGDPACIDFLTGRVQWKEKAPFGGSAAVLYADGHLLFRYDRGPMVLAEATPQAFRLKGSFTPLTVAGPAWAYPVIHQKKLYLRHNDLLLCYDISGNP